MRGTATREKLNDPKRMADMSEVFLPYAQTENCCKSRPFRYRVIIFIREIHSFSRYLATPFS